MLFRTLDLSIEKRERLTCPLSSCKKTFEDQQYLELVNHVSSCPYLERGLYDCPYCHKEESFCWELPYSVDESDSNGSLHTISPGENANQPVNANTNPNMNNHQSTTSEADQTHLFSSTFAEFDRDAFPEVFVSHADHRPSHSSRLAAETQYGNKRSYSEFADERTVESSFAEFSNDNLPEITRGYPVYQPQLDLTGMAYELPSNVAGHNSSHLSPTTSPEVLQSNSPQLMHQAMELNLDPFQMTGPASPGFHYNLGPPALASPSNNPHAQRRRLSSQSASPRGNSRALSNASTITHHQSPNSQLDPGNVDLLELMGSPQSRRSSRASESSGGVRSPRSSNMPEEAEKSSVQCKECGRVFTGKVAWLPSNLQRHMREAHLNAPKTRCRKCGKDFNRGHNLRHHMKAVHGEQP